MTKRPDDKAPLFLARLGAGMIEVLFIFLFVLDNTEGSCQGG